MSIDYDAFLSWAESRFVNIKANGREIMVNSPFCEDHKTHLWCNVEGGRHSRENGVYRCWKTDRRGTLVGLVMEIDNCPYDVALDRIKGNETEAVKHAKVITEFCENLKKEKQNKNNKVEFPPNSLLVSDLENDYRGNEAILYLNKRKIDYKKYKLRFCLDQGDYDYRIVIPYYDKNNNLIYFNCRHLSDKVNPKYLGPKEKIYKVGKREVLYFTHWPEKNSLVFLTEGEFDAMSLNTLCGFAGVACAGKSLSNQHIDMLRDYKVCVAFDNDSAGIDAYTNICKSLKENGISPLYVVPPKGFKDWNKLLEKGNKESSKEYIIKSMKRFEKWEIKND